MIDNERVLTVHVVIPYRYISMPTLSPLLQSVDLSGSNLPDNTLEQLLSALTHRARSLSSSQQKSIKISLCQCGLKTPLPLVHDEAIVVVTNPSLLLKTKQSCTDKFVAMLELSDNDVTVC